jgi:hypothetical protein
MMRTSTYKYNICLMVSVILGLLNCQVDRQNGCHKMICSKEPYCSGPDKVNKDVQVSTQLNDVIAL